MTAHRRAWTLRAGLVAVMAAGALLGVAAPSHAAPSGLTVTASDVNLQVGGGTQTTTVEVKNFDITPATNVQVTITIPLSDYQVAALQPAGCTLNGPSEVDCTIASIGAGQSKTKVIQIKPPATASINTGDSKSGTGQVVLDSGASGSFKVTLQGPSQQAPTMVTAVTGFVKDVATGAPVPGASVQLQDSAGHNFTASSSSLGAFSFRSTPANPIAPGLLAVGAQKAGYKNVTGSANVQAGQTYAFPPLQMESLTAASPSDAPSVPVVAPPSDNVSVAPLTNTDAASSSGGSGFSMILIAAGALLVLLGIGAIVLIVLRRRRDDGEDPGEYDDAPPPRRGPSPVPASRGNYRGGPDATAVVRGGYNDPTMVGRGSPLADAPTTMQRPVVDEYPDPYGAPPPRSPQPYGGGYDNGGQGGGYGGNTYGAGGGYGDRRGGEYGGGAGAPYGGIYGQPDEPPARGYDAGGYDAPSPRSGGGGYGGGGYESPPARGGYDAGGYDAGGYQPRGDAYDQPTSGGGHRDSSGYGGSRGGYPPEDEYDQPRGGGHDRRGGGQPPDSRGRLDWLDD